MRRTARAFTITAAVLLALVLLAAGAVGVLATTAFGARTAFALLDDRVPGEVAVGTIEGSLARGLVLRDVRYANDGIEVALGLVMVVPATAELLGGAIVLERIAIADGYVALASDANAVPAERPLAAPALPTLPADFAVRTLEIANVTLRGLGDDIVIAEARASASGERSSVFGGCCVAIIGNATHDAVTPRACVGCV
jgi:autotransporter translocation and assembly factor TamB